MSYFENNNFCCIAATSKSLRARNPGRNRATCENAGGQADYDVNVAGFCPMGHARCGDTPVAMPRARGRRCIFINKSAIANFGETQTNVSSAEHHHCRRRRNRADRDYRRPVFHHGLGHLDQRAADHVRSAFAFDLNVVNAFLVTFVFYLSYFVMGAAVLPMILIAPA